MKGLFFLIVLIIAALFIYANFIQKPSQPETSQPAATTATSQPGPGQAMGNQPAATPAPVAPNQNLLTRIQAVAKQTGVTIQSSTQSGKEMRVQVEWMGDVATIGGDFIEALLREGIIRDFQEEAGRRWYDKEGRSHFTQAYTLKF